MILQVTLKLSERNVKMGSNYDCYAARAINKILKEGYYARVGAENFDIFHKKEGIPFTDVSDIPFDYWDVLERRLEEENYEDLSLLLSLPTDVFENYFRQEMNLEVKRTPKQSILTDLFQQYCKETEPQYALRDLLTDLRHVIVDEVDFQKALEGSLEVYQEEINE